MAIFSFLTSKDVCFQNNVLRGKNQYNVITRKFPYKPVEVHTECTQNKLRSNYTAIRNARELRKIKNC